MKFKDIETTPEEVIQSLKDAGIDILEPDNIEFNDTPTLKEQMESIEKRFRMIDELQNIISDLNERAFWDKTNIKVLYDLSWNEICDKGIELLEKLKMVGRR